MDRPSLLTRGFVLLSAADLAYFTAVGVSVYALPLYVTGPLNSSDGQAGLAFGAFAVSALVLRPFSGRLCDTLGRRPLLIGGALLAAVGLGLTAMTEDLLVVIALRLLLGVAEAAFFVASLAALVDLVPPERMGEAISYNSLGLYLGLALGPPLGEAIVETRGYEEAWWAAAALALGAAVVAGAVGETNGRPGSSGERARLIHRPALPAALAFGTSLVAIGGFLAFAALHAEDVGLADSSIPLLVYGLVVVFLRIALARVMDRFVPLRLGAVALVTVAVALGLAALWTTPAGMITGTVLLAVGVTISTPAFFAAIFATASESERGAASGTASLFIDLGLGGGPMLLGLVVHVSDIPAAFGAAAAVAALGALWTLRLDRVRLIANR